MPMFVNIELDKPRRLRFTFNDLADVDAKLGSSVLYMLADPERIAERFNFNVFRTLLWAGLKWEDHTLTVERVGNIIDSYLEKGGDFNYVVEKLIEGLVNSGIFKKKEEKPGNPKAEAAK